MGKLRLGALCHLRFSSRKSIVSALRVFLPLNDTRMGLLHPRKGKVFHPTESRQFIRLAFPSPRGVAVATSPRFAQSPAEAGRHLPCAHRCPSPCLLREDGPALLGQSRGAPLTAQQRPPSSMAALGACAQFGVHRPPSHEPSFRSLGTTSQGWHPSLFKHSKHNESYHTTSPQRVEL